MAGCSKTAEHVPTGTTLEIPLTHSYKAQEILMAEKLGWTHFYQFGEQVLTHKPADTEDAASSIGLYNAESGSFLRRETDISHILGTSVQGDTIDVMIQEIAAGACTDPAPHRQSHPVMEREMTDSNHHSNFMYMAFAGEEVEVYPATAEEAAMVTEYFKGITVCGIPDQFIYNIAAEETDKFFAGDCTAEDAARVIQSRVSLYLAEQQ